jgi:hypothetical protein
MKATSWLLLLYSLPTNRNTERVAVWRRLKKIGAVQIKTSTYLLPDQPAQYEQFQWLAKQIRDFGGDSTLVRAQEIEGLTKEKVVSLFNAARDKEYVELKKGAAKFRCPPKKVRRRIRRRRAGAINKTFPGASPNRFLRQPPRSRCGDVTSACRRTEAFAETPNARPKAVLRKNLADSSPA